MALTDWIIVAVIALAVLGGLTQGFIRSVFSLGGLFAGLVLGAWNYRLVAAPLRHLLNSEEGANVVAFLLIAFAVMAVASIIGSLVARTIDKVGLGCLDRLAGGVFGLLQGVLLVTLFILVTVAFYPRAHWLVEARLPRHFFAACHLSTNMSPDELAQRVRSGLMALEGETPDWLHPQNGKS
jgi:membrane protein required for colicin V production